MAGRLKIKLGDEYHTELIINPGIISVGYSDVEMILVLNGSLKFKYNEKSKDILINDFNRVRTSILDDRNWSEPKPSQERK